jgi:C-terminal processing protease CtpA/Prc
VRRRADWWIVPAEREEFRAHFAYHNFCFERVERLPGNIGYVDLRCFGPPELSAETVAAVFTFLNHTHALIMDLRENGGGDPAGVALISSYLFDKPTHLSDIYVRRDDHTEQFWTLPYVTGRRFAGTDVYVRTSAQTFSGAEDFSYNLKHLKRAKISGEVTGGGAHPASGHRINAHCGIIVPFARSINPITKAN